MVAIALQHCRTSFYNSFWTGKSIRPRGHNDFLEGFVGKFSIGCRSAAVLAVATLGFAAISASPAGAAKADKSPISIGYISNLTGIASSTFADGAGGAQAVIDQLNAAGGIDGHPINLIVKDDTSSLSADATESQELIADHVSAVIDYSAFAEEGAPYFQKAGIPVFGSGFDGPEWFTAPYSNMFTWYFPSAEVGTNDYVYGFYGQFLKDEKVKSFGGLGYGVSPSSTNSVYEAEKSANEFGIPTCYTNNTVPFGSTDFTAAALQINQSKCGAVAGSFVESSDLALSTALKQSGSKTFGLFFTGYDSNVSSPVNRAGFNDDFAQASVSFSPPNAAASALLKVLKKYDPSYHGGIPDFGLTGSAISAQLAVYALKLVASNPTPSAIISAMHKVKAWNDNGLLPTSMGFEHAGTPGIFPKKVCSYFEELKGSSWTVATGAPVCGTLSVVAGPSS
jgi:branched-chain amino acid transport system substrate-binding protein